MKKSLIAFGLLALGLISGDAFTTTVTLNPGASTLAISNACRVTQVVITANAATNTSAQLIDANTNGTLYVVAGYTNTITYGTNINLIYTNFYGVLNTNILTNSIVDATQTNAPATNSFPVKIAVGASGGTSYKIDQVNYYFGNGVMVTNTATGFGPASVTITWFYN
jgi:hypothetical protein